MFSNAKQLLLTIQTFRKFIVNADEKVMHWEDIGRRSRKAYYAKVRNPPFIKAPGNWCNSRSPIIMGPAKDGYQLVLFWLLFLCIQLEQDRYFHKGHVIRYTGTQES